MNYLNRPFSLLSAEVAAFLMVLPIDDAFPELFDVALDEELLDVALDEELPEPDLE